MTNLRMIARLSGHKINADDAMLACQLLSLEEVMLEERSATQPSHGYQSVHDYIDWWSDGEDSRYETN